MTPSIADLTEREKQALRLLVRGHDAKSIARHLGLSVHTVNDRLRDARRKLGVSSSREAARLLLETEGFGPDYVAPQEIGEAGRPPPVPAGGSARIGSAAVLAGVVAMLLALAVLLASPVAHSPTGPTQADAAAPAVEASARAWLALVDQGRWEESWRATGSSFRKLNTAAAWARASEKNRAPLGAAVSRTLLAQEDVPAPPQGYRMVKFRTSFANKADATETVTLDREDGEWRVVGVYVG